jgi:hypothetical protein
MYFRQFVGNQLEVITKSSERILLCTDRADQNIFLLNVCSRKISPVPFKQIFIMHVYEIFVIQLYSVL